jgi:CDP-diacylglycerol--glycerol-3-phosphate 3-phosphatidyltransferase
VGQAPVERRPGEQARLTFRRLSGLDRSGPPPPQTVSGAPLNPWTIPNAIVALRLLGIPVFLVLVYRTDSGHSVAAALLYLGLALSDYLDGIAARVTGQYSRLGTIIDPLVDRLLVVAGLVACWSYELLPRWALAVLIARELFMVGLARYGMRHGIEIRINWPGRIGVWWVLGAPFWAIAGVHWAGLLCLYIGLVFTLWATVLYVRSGLLQRSSRA